MQVTRATFIPLLAPAISDRVDPGVVRDEYCGDLTVVYTFGPQFGRRVVTHADLEQMELSPRVLRRSALDHLEVLSSRAEFHGQPPALMLSFEGLESSLLLANDFWTRLQGAVPGELVVGAPARDVVIVTGSQSVPGLEKVRRCVDRVFFAGDEHLLSRGLLVRRGGAWEPFDRPARPGGRPGHAVAHQHGRGQPPRQYQEHPSWPGERVPVATMRPMSPMVPGGPAGRPMHPGPPLAPAAQMPAPHMPAAPMPSSPRPAAASMSPTGMTGAIPVGPMPGGPPPPPIPVPRQRLGSGGRPIEHPPRPADIAQYSAIPYSAVPYSAVPYSAVPYSAVPYSGVPYSGVPYSQPGRAHSAQRPSFTEAKPAYRDDVYSTGSYPRPLYSERAPVSAAPAPASRRPGYEPAPAYQPEPEPEAQPPVYPASWGYAPEASGRSEWRSGPRARFSR